MKQRTTRRELLALSACAPLAVAAAAHAQDLAQERAQEPTQKPDSPRALATQALTDILHARYGKHLSDEQWKRVGQSIGRNLGAAEQMQRVALANGDEPSFAFVALPEG